MMQIAQLPSPNQAKRVGKYREHGPAYIVVHYSGMAGPEAVLAHFSDPASDVSAHYFIDQAGAVTQLVDEDKRAYHAGDSCWRGERHMNSASIGIELDNRGHNRGYHHFSSAQIDAFAALCGEVQQRWNIHPENVVAHSDIAPHRKADPGELFPWEQLAQQGIGVWPTQVPLYSVKAEPLFNDMQEYLFDIGYDCPRNRLLPLRERTIDPRTMQCVTAFQRHYIPEELHKGITMPTVARLDAVHRLLFRQDGARSFAKMRCLTNPPLCPA